MEPSEDLQFEDKSESDNVDTEPRTCYCGYFCCGCLDVSKDDFF